MYSGLQFYRYRIYSFLFKTFRSCIVEGWSKLYWHLRMLSSMVTKIQSYLFCHPHALPEIRDFLMNGGGLITSSKRWYEAEFCLQFKQSCLRVWGVLQSIFTTWIIRCIGSLTLAKPHALLHNSHDNHTSFQLLHVERLEHDGSLVSASSVSLRLGVVCQDAQAIVLPHPRKCD